MKAWKQLGLALLALGVAACATDRAPEGPPPSGMLSEQVVTVTATVEKIDLKTRQVTLRGPDGRSTTVKAGERVRNLAQVKKGDEVTLSYYESLAYEVKRSGEAEVGAGVAAAAAAAEPGERPAGLEAQQLTITSTIAEIDERAGTVTLKKPDGELFTTRVRRPENLKRVRVGDLVELTYTEAVAVSVEAAPAKAK